MNFQLRSASFLGAALLFCMWTGIADAQQPAWTGQGSYRVVVEVPPVQDLGRAEDEMVASVELDLQGLFPDVSANYRIDLHSLQVIREDSRAAPFAKHTQQRCPQGRPFRFYDSGLLDEFPTWRRYASLEALGNRPVMQPKERLQFGHRVFNPVAEHGHGTLVWAHTQTGNATSTYGIYFDVVPKTQSITSPPAGWIGDGSNRIVRHSRAPGPPGNGSASVVDWNGDGLPDLLYGVSSGYVIVAENTGSHENPAFDRRRMIFDASGTPIDVGYDACPLSVDWNADGVRDLLIGAEKGCILYFANGGTDADPAFEFTGFVEADGAMLLTPNWPIAEQPHGKAGDVFPADYLAIPCVCDWDGDGDSDLLAGGFVTGWIFLFENVGQLDNGTPDLRARGPLTVDGEPLDTGWAAAPVTVDLDHDGDLDLICGAKSVTPVGGDTSDPTGNLQYFENVGNRTRPVLKKRPFPASGPPQTGTTLMAPVCDWNGDSLPDLLLVTRSSMQVFAVPNIGSRKVPMFDMSGPAISAEWTSQSLPPGTFMDWNHDGLPDLMNRFSVFLNDGTGLPHSFSRRVSIMAGQPPIRHPPPHGDENSYVTLHDMDGDGDHDCIYGAHSGYIWFHENRGSDAAPVMDTDGYRLPLIGGGLVQVGEAPADKEPGFNFTDLQGARPKPAPADFDQDGRVDLVVGDTYGRVRYFRNAGRGENGRHRFAAPVMIHQSNSRLSVHAADWTGDDVADVFVITGSRVALFPNLAMPGRGEFGEPTSLPLPKSIGGFYGVSPGDINGDGDTDIVYHTSARITCYVERSFLTHGYRAAKIISTETREQ
ncbi:MAG TPA: VCBS repeat-containing protein [Planctomycetes bacterium]|nr:VCBS repeat-containing protein [Fuerstiella sp.]HIK90455.1 VCBS repeat-containing protein [Planctomycetota bacterium]